MTNFDFNAMYLMFASRPGYVEEKHKGCHQVVVILAIDSNNVNTNDNYFYLDCRVKKT
ncbi:hypothetical protein GCM10017161_29140 [Thalassotalea marina]|uniref:Uncharacterized protein n=1 Tax=Thalassotalea marina TaxID=1673741 RepID=A0A919BMT1_9GAMM|nr:hypothetical protein GCM10017161_29140 [Thalassotalea marina]